MGIPRLGIGEQPGPRPRAAPNPALPGRLPASDTRTCPEGTPPGGGLHPAPVPAGQETGPRRQRAPARPRGQPLTFPNQPWPTSSRYRRLWRPRSVDLSSCTVTGQGAQEPRLGLSAPPSALPGAAHSAPALSPPAPGPQLGGCHQEQDACCPGELWTCELHLGIFLDGSGKAGPQTTGTSRKDSRAWSQDQCVGNARQAGWPGPSPWGGGPWSRPSPHPCRRLAFQHQAHQRLLCWGLLGTAVHGTHWAHSPAASLGEVSREEGSAGALEDGPRLPSPLTPCPPRDSPNSAPTPTALRAQGTGLGRGCQESPGDGGRLPGNTDLDAKQNLGWGGSHWGSSLGGPPPALSSSIYSLNRWHLLLGFSALTSGGGCPPTSPPQTRGILQI